MCVYLCVHRCTCIWVGGVLEGNLGGISQLFLETASLTGLELSDKLGVAGQWTPGSIHLCLFSAGVTGSIHGARIFKAWLSCLQGKEFTRGAFIPPQQDGSSCLQCVKTFSHTYTVIYLCVCAIDIHDCVHIHKGVHNLCKYEFGGQREIWCLSLLITQFLFLLLFCLFIVLSSCILLNQKLTD